MEHIIFHCIMDHAQLNNILIDNQHGFRSGFSCQTQLISLIDDISHAMDNQYQTDLILLDFSKAFDTVPHKRLLTKLQHNKIDNLNCVGMDAIMAYPTYPISGLSMVHLHNQ